MPSTDYDALRRAITSGAAAIEVTPLEPSDIDDIAWSGSAAHLENVVEQLGRVETGEAEYLAVRADGHAVSKGGIDFARESDAGTIWAVGDSLLTRGDRPCHASHLRTGSEGTEARGQQAPARGGTR
jgi:hypothetical protein